MISGRGLHEESDRPDPGLLRVSYMPDVARLPFEGREDASVLGSVGTFSNLLGSGAVQSCRNLARQGGLEHGGSPGRRRSERRCAMTPLPAGSIWDEIRVVSQVGDGLRVRCPIWTETGRSGLAIEIIVERKELGSLYIDTLVDDRGNIVMSTADAPNSNQSVGVDLSGEEAVAAGGDPRIRREAFVVCELRRADWSARSRDGASGRQPARAS